MLPYTTGAAARIFQPTNPIRPAIAWMRENRREGEHALQAKPQRRARFGLAFAAVM